ncbi:MAG: 1,4-dihydroxy-2-naphthoate polyprenyltransferase, partial [Pseudomonadota bacterium]
RGAKIEYVCLLAGAYITPPVLLASGLLSVFSLLPILSLPMAFALVRSILYKEGPVLNKTLAGTAQLSLLFSVLFSIGLVLS